MKKQNTPTINSSSKY